MIAQPEPRIKQVMADTGMGRMQAINHLRSRHQLQRRHARQRRTITGASA